MALNKTLGNVLKGGLGVAGVAACFTPVGAMCGLGGVAAVGVDLVAGGIISKGIDHIKGAIDKASEKEKPKKDAAHPSSDTQKGASGVGSGAALGGASGALLTSGLLMNRQGRNASSSVHRSLGDLTQLRQHSTLAMQQSLARMGVREEAKDGLERG